MPSNSINQLSMHSIWKACVHVANTRTALCSAKSSKQMEHEGDYSRVEAILTGFFDRPVFEKSSLVSMKYFNLFSGSSNIGYSFFTGLTGTATGSLVTSIFEMV